MHDATLDHQTGNDMDSQYRTITYIDYDRGKPLRHPRVTVLYGLPAFTVSSVPARSTAHPQDRQSAQTRRRTVDICCMTKKRRNC